MMVTILFRFFFEKWWLQAESPAELVSALHQIEFLLRRQYYLKPSENNSKLFMLSKTRRNRFIKNKLRPLKTLYRYLYVIKLMFDNVSNHLVSLRLHFNPESFFWRLFPNDFYALSNFVKRWHTWIFAGFLQVHEYVLWGWNLPSVKKYPRIRKFLNSLNCVENGFSQCFPIPYIWVERRYFIKALVGHI